MHIENEAEGVMGAILQKTWLLYFIKHKNVIYVCT